MHWNQEVLLWCTLGKFKGENAWNWPRLPRYGHKMIQDYTRWSKGSYNFTVCILWFYWLTYQKWGRNINRLLLPFFGEDTDDQAVTCRSQVVMERRRRRKRHWRRTKVSRCKMGEKWKAIQCFSSPLLVGQIIQKSSGWWFGTFFPYIGNNHPQLTFIFFRYVETTSHYCGVWMNLDELKWWDHAKIIAVDRPLLGS